MAYQYDYCLQISTVYSFKTMLQDLQ